MSLTKAKLDKLRTPFTADQVKQREGPGGRKLDYVAIETVLERMLSEAPGYSWTIHATDVRMTVDGKRHMAIVTGSFLVDGAIAFGVGAMVHADLDMAVKSANSEAMKNAAKNGFGVGLELWDADHRDELARQRANSAGDVTTLKASVYAKAQEELDDESPTGAEVADHFNVTVADLNKVPVLKKILGL